MTQEAILAIIVAAVTALMGGGLLGAIFTGMATKAGIKKTGADALATYQEIANIAAESLLAAQLREKESQARCEFIIDKLDKEVKTRGEENAKLKHVISAWSVGIKVLHNQLESLEQSPRWKPEVDELMFLEEKNKKEK